MGGPSFDATDAHKYFAVECFNRAWGLIEKSERAASEDEEMLLLSMASTWHWTRREDCRPVNLAVGYWQISRVHAILGRADEARRYGQLSLDACAGEGVDAFTRGYAYEALARAESIAGNRAKVEEHLVEARRAADKVTDEESRGWLVDDLNSMTA